MRKTIKSYTSYIIIQHTPIATTFDSTHAMYIILYVHERIVFRLLKLVFYVLYECLITIIKNASAPCSMHIMRLIDTR